MPTFTSTAAINSYVKKMLKPALVSTKLHVLKIIENSMKDFYFEYTPIEYERTHQLLSSMVDNGIVIGGSGGSFEIYFDSSRMSHPRPAIGYSGEEHEVEWSEEEILSNSFTSGLPHGGIGGNPIWPNILDGIQDIPEILKSSLIAAGVPIY